MVIAHGRHRVPSVFTSVIPPRSDHCHPSGARRPASRSRLPMVAAAREARGTLTRPSPPVRSRVGASAVTVAQQRLRFLELRETPCSRAGPFSNCGLLRGSDVPAGDKRRPGFGRRLRPQGASLPPRESIRRPTQSERGAGPGLLAKLQMVGDSAGCLSRDIAETGRCPLRPPISDLGRELRHTTDGGSDASQGPTPTRCWGTTSGAMGCRSPSQTDIVGCPSQNPIATINVKMRGPGSSSAAD